MTSESTSSTRVARLPRRLTRAAAASLVVSVTALALPASADVPEGWSTQPEDVDMLQALLLLAGVPLLLFVVIALLTYLPALVRGEKLSPGAAEDQWFGGPRQGPKELESAEQADETGGARGRW